MENLFNPGEKIDPANVRILNIELAQESIECRCGEFASPGVHVEKNHEKLSAEEYLKKNHGLYLGIPSQYEDFYVNEPITFAGLQGRRFGDVRTQQIVITNSQYIFIISEGDLERDNQIFSTFKFIE